MSPSSLLNNALSVALLAAVGNALFAFGQRRAEVSQNPFLFILSALVVCTVAFALTMPLFDRTDLSGYILRNAPWILISGVGFYLTFVGFYFLYSRFGASYYILYAVLSIITTSVIVGLVIFGEPVNRYHIAAIGTAILTVILFAIARNQG